MHGSPNKPARQEPPPLELAFPTRRSFVGWLLGIGAVTVGALLSVPLVRFALYPLFARTTETTWSDLGAVDEFNSLRAPLKRVVTIEQRDGWRKAVSEKPVYVTRDAQGQVRVLSSVCPHLGCSVSWNETKGQFICPCHAGVFHADGSRVSGPPPRSMDDLQIKIESGRLMVRYQYFRQLVPTKEVLG